MHGFNDFRRKREIPSKTEKRNTRRVEKRNILVRHDKMKKSEIIKYLTSTYLSDEYRIVVVLCMSGVYQAYFRLKRLLTNRRYYLTT